MSDIWHDYMKPKFEEKAKLCYMETCNFMVYIKKVFIYINIAKYNEKRLNTSNYKLNKLLPKGKSKRID